MANTTKSTSKLALWPRAMALIALCCALAIAWWIYEPYQSHFLIGLRVLGDATTNNIIGVAKEGRGDEWATYIPFLKQASLEGFPNRSSLAPYYENYNWFITIPKADFSLFFLPNNLAYFLLPAGKALSLQGVYYNLLMLFSVFWYMRNLRIGAWVSTAVAISILFSHFYQVWWTSNFPVLASIFLPFAVLTSGLRTLPKMALLYWSVGHLVFGQLYPPFYVSVAIALLPLTLVLRPDLLRLQTILYAALAALLALIIYFFVYGDFIAAIGDTSYPGRRFSQGGGSSWSALFSSVVPTLPVVGRSDEHRLYELSIIGTVIPIFSVSLLPWVKWDKQTIRLTIVTILTAVALSWYAVVGFPANLSKYTGLFLVPGTRIHMGFSILIIVYSGYLISRNIGYLNRGALLFVGATYAGLSACVWVPTPLEFTWYQSYPYIFLALILLACGVTLNVDNPAKRAKLIGVGVLCSMSGAHVLIFGSFNPLMRGSDIMTPVETPFTKQWRELLELNGGKPMAIAGNFGHLLRGEGLPALEAIHLVSVEPHIYKELFPYLSDREVDNYFNRFVGISFDNVVVPEFRGASVAFPLLKHAVLIPHSVERSLNSGDSERLEYDSDRFRIVDLNNGEYSVYWSGVLRPGIPLSKTLRFSLPCEVTDSHLTRGPLPGDNADSGHRLMTGALTVKSDSVDGARSCAAKLGLSLSP